MPRAWDRRQQGSADHNPLSGLLDFESVDETAKKAGSPIRTALDGMLSLLGLGGILQFVQQLLGGGVDGVAVWTNIANVFLKPLNFFAELIGGFIKAAIIPGLDASKIISGLFPTSMVNGLNSFLVNVQNALQSIPGGGIVGGLIGFWADFVNSILGHGSGAVPAYTSANSAIANVQGQINAIQAQISATGEGYADGFNYPPLSADWAVVYGGVDITSGGFVWNAGGAGNRYGCRRLNASRPDTTLYQIQMTVIFPQDGGATAQFGSCRFGGGANAAMSGRFPAVELYVDQFGARVRLGSVLGPLNAPGNASAGWTQYGEINLTPVLKTGDVLALEVDEVNKIYRVYLNPGPGSSPLAGLSFLDSGNTISRGVGQRDAWFQLNVLNDPFGVGNGWDNAFVFDRT